MDRVEKDNDAYLELLERKSELDRLLADYRRLLSWVCLKEGSPNHYRYLKERIQPHLLEPEKELHHRCDTLFDQVVESALELEQFLEKIIQKEIEVLPKPTLYLDQNLMNVQKQFDRLQSIEIHAIRRMSGTLQSDEPVLDRLVDIEKQKTRLRQRVLRKLDGVSLNHEYRIHVREQILGEPSWRFQSISFIRQNSYNSSVESWASCIQLQRFLRLFAAFKDLHRQLDRYIEKQYQKPKPERHYWSAAKAAYWLRGQRALTSLDNLNGSLILVQKYLEKRLQT